MVSSQLKCELMNESVMNNVSPPNSNAVLARAIENVESPLNSNDPDLLLLKAISAASTHCLFQCMNLLQRHQEVNNRPESAA